MCCVSHNILLKKSTRRPRPRIKNEFWNHHHPAKPRAATYERGVPSYITFGTPRVNTLNTIDLEPGDVLHPLLKACMHLPRVCCIGTGAREELTDVLLYRGLKTRGRGAGVAWGFRSNAPATLRSVCASIYFHCNFMGNDKMKFCYLNIPSFLLLAQYQGALEIS